MPDVLFQGLFDKYTISIPVSHFLICLLVSLVIGLFYTFIYSYKKLVVTKADALYSLFLNDLERSTI